MTRSIRVSCAMCEGLCEITEDGYTIGCPHCLAQGYKMENPAGPVSAMVDIDRLREGMTEGFDEPAA